MERLPDNDLGYPGVRRVPAWRFRDCAAAPMFDVSTVHGLNYVIGLAKHLNEGACDVVYRGQPGMFPTLRPALTRGVKLSERVELCDRLGRLDDLVGELCGDKRFVGDLGLDGSGPDLPKHVEAVLQHYGVPTRFLDAADNHWVALWFGAHRFESVRAKSGGGESFGLYRRREVSLLDLYETGFGSAMAGKIDPEQCYQYIVLIAVGEDLAAGRRPPVSVEVTDLRKVLPSTFLRPHAQHGVVLTMAGGNRALDFAESVVGIVRVRIDRAQRWLGSGHLISYANLFPSPAYDEGYGVLLRNAPVFDRYGWPITSYIYDVG